MKVPKQSANSSTNNDADQIFDSTVKIDSALKQQVIDIDNLFCEQRHQFSSLWHTPLCHNDTDDKCEGEDKPKSRLKFSDYSTRFAHAPHHAVSMWIADMDTAPPKHVADAISAFVTSHYGYQSIDIGEIVAKRYAKHHAVVASHMVVSTVSVMAAVDTALKVCTNQGDKVMILSPTYGPLRERIAAQGLEVVNINDAAIDGSELSISELNPDCTAFVLCHPNNPTGTTLREELQHDIARFCSAHNITLIVDEVHSEFGFVDADTNAQIEPPSDINPFAINDRPAQQHIIRINSAGKAFNLSAIPAASYAIISNDELRRKFAREIDNCHLEASPIAKIALIAAYEKADDWLAFVLKAIAFNRQYAKALMKIISPTTPFTLGNAGYFLWLNLNQRFPNDMFVQTCQRGVIGVDGANFNAPGHLRLNLACHPNAIKIALLRLFTD